ncbi:MAG: hypothetical protein ABJQ08_11695 [Paracoccaceae bacterium]
MADDKDSGSKKGHYYQTSNNTVKRPSKLIDEMIEKIKEKKDD